MGVRTKMLVVSGIVLVLLSVGSVICFAWAATGKLVAAAGSPPTRVIRFSPSGIRGTLKTPADCWVASLAAPRANAWRCMVVNTIYDPCFSTSAQAKYVVCDADPAGDTRGVKVVLAHPLPAASIPAETGTQVWEMRLTDGTICSYMTGTSGIFGGERLNYGCVGGGWIVGFPTPDKIWTVKEIVKGQPQPTIKSVAEAWT